LVHQDVRRQRQHVIFEERNFYGAIQVHEQVHGDGSVLRSLMHGRVCHGIQFDRPPRRSTPSSYFSAEAGLGKAITAMRARGRPLRIGALGMGIGVLAAYGEHGDSINFFELNPAVIKLARNTDYFTYLADSRASIHITEGDARLELEEERRSGNDEPYDMLVIDVFSGDSVPVHCLTSEAFSLYAKSLTPDGILAVHVSNAFLDLTQPVRAATKHLGWHSAYIRTRGDRFLTADAAWILLAYSEDALSNTCITEATTPWPTPLRMDDPWTDRFSSLYPLLTWTPRSPLAPRMEQGSRP
jgi:predicted O-methyltransferase YrrM